MAPVSQRTVMLDPALCAAVFERARATDLLILCFGIGLGVMFYALAHDLALRYGRRREMEDDIPPFSLPPSYASALHRSRTYSDSKLLPA